ncbi:hypothetical protein HYW82_00550 [Candidatus Peregrinibacteria bacterium]|nr:hypothetical protein [Candidatus Peregrinibacteria bacterium]
MPTILHRLTFGGDFLLFWGGTVISGVMEKAAGEKSVMDRSVRGNILQPMFFTPRDIKIDEPCTPRDIFNDARFMSLLSPGFEFAQPLFERVLDLDPTLSRDEIEISGRAFRTALSRWHKKLAWLERTIPYAEKTDDDHPLSTRDLVNAITSAAETFFRCLLKLEYKTADNPEIDGDAKAAIVKMIAEIHRRVASVVLYEGVPAATMSSIGNCLFNNILNLKTIGDMDVPDVESAIYFGGSKRSDVACATNGERLMQNLHKLRLDPKEFEVVTLRLSGNTVMMVIPRGAQGLVGLKDLFAEVGLLITAGEARQNSDIVFLGAPDEVFDGVEGVVQGNEGSIKNVDGGYKRFHYTGLDGSVIHVVGRGKDSNGNDIDYFGPYKKLPFQAVAMRQLRESTQLLARTGRPVVQPMKGTTSFEYETCERNISDEDALSGMVMPVHGTFLCWSHTGITLDQVSDLLARNLTDNHTILEGQSGMGKSEMEQFIRKVCDNLRYLHEMMSRSDNDKLRYLAGGLAPLADVQLYSTGDDMGQLEVNEKSQLKLRTHEMSRFTRLDNIPTIENLVARATHPLKEDGTVALTTNTRVLQRDKELEALHQVPVSARIFVLATNMPLDVDGFDPNAPVQELSFEQYMTAYAKYKNKPNGTKNSDDPVQSPAAMHEFLGQFSIAGGVECENVVAVRRFMLESEIKRRKENKRKPMRFYVINTGINPDWMTRREFEVLDDTGKQKARFANAARHWVDVPGLLPEEIRQSLKHAEENLGLNLAKLAYHSGSWTVAKLEKVFREQVLATQRSQ